MIECGVPVIEILSSLNEVDANTLFAAGVPLDTLLRDLLGLSTDRWAELRGHPPVKKYTLFDSQLQAAGYTASEFRSAGFTAQDLSYNYFLHDNQTPGELEWAQCNAFFDALDLKNAGFTAIELLHARFTLEDLQKAGFPECELPQAKRMPRPSSGAYS